MLVQYYTLDGILLLERPQDAIPHVGDLVPVVTSDGRRQTYRVHHCCWPLRRTGGGSTYYSLSEAKDCLVEIHLEDTDAL